MRTAWALSFIALLHGNSLADMNDFLERDLVLAEVKNPDLQKAIRESQNSLPVFLGTAIEPGKVQRDFVVVVLRSEESKLVPYGIRVESVNNDSILGKIFRNNNESLTPESISVKRSQVIDWRFTDCGESIGANVYRQQLKRHRPSFQRSLRENGIMWLRNEEEEISSGLRKRFADLVNSKTQEASEIRKVLIELENTRIPIPILESRNNGNLRTMALDCFQFCAAFGSKELLIRFKNAGVPMDLHKMASMSITSNNESTFAMLMEQSFDVNKEIIGSKGSFLHAACTHDRPVFVKMLLERKANVNFYSPHAGLPIHSAISVEVVRLLIDAGSKLDAEDHSGWTPLDKALMRRDWEVVDLLLERGATKSKYDLESEEILSREKSRNMLKEYAASVGKTYDPENDNPGWFLPQNELIAD
jgi:hypothetical protein